MAENAKKNFKNYDYISRYESFPYFYDEENNRYYYGLQSNLENENIVYAAYTVKPGDSYDSIALDYYGSALLFWVICDFNRILDPFTNPKPGTILQLPALNSIYFKR